MITLDESTLIAYVDGELDSQTAREVEVNLGKDENARKYVEHLREIVALSRVAFNDTLHEAVPQALKDTILKGGVTQDSQPENVVAFAPRAKSEWTLALPMAAAVACLLLGLGGGYQYSETSSNKAVKLAAFSLEQDQMSMNGALNKALEVNLENDTHTWINPNTGRSAAFTPVHTYQDKSGKFCREYRKDTTAGEQKETTFGLACRNDQGMWKTRYLIMQDDAGQAL